LVKLKKKRDLQILPENLDYEYGFYAYISHAYIYDNNNEKVWIVLRVSIGDFLSYKDGNTARKLIASIIVPGVKELLEKLWTEPEKPVGGYIRFIYEENFRSVTKISKNLSYE